MYHIKDLAAEEINMIASALGKHPYELVHKLIGKIKEQVEAIEAEFRAQPDSNQQTVTPQPVSPTEQPAPAA